MRSKLLGSVHQSSRFKALYLSATSPRFSNLDSERERLRHRKQQLQEEAAHSVDAIVASKGSQPPCGFLPQGATF